MGGNGENFWENCWKSEAPGELSAYLDRYYQWKDPVIDVFKEHRIETVCDAACGFGAYSLAFASNGFRVRSFDISTTAVALTRRGLERYGIDIDAKAASILSTGYEDAAFDGVIANSVLDHLTAADAEKALAELYRITRPGGLILASFDTPEEADREMDHEVLADGSLRYAPHTSRAGMIYRPCGEAEISRFLSGKDVIYAHTSQNGKQIRILEKHS